METMATKVKWMVLTVLLALLVACGDSGTTAPSSTQASKLSARFIGTMPPDLADELNQEFSQVSAASAAPLIISGVDVSTLSETERNSIKATFDNDIPIILVRPTRTQRQALRSLVGLEGADLTDDIPEFWGLQTSRKFEIWEYSSAPPAERQTTDTDVTAYQEDGTSQTTDGPVITDYFFDMPDYQLSRVAGLREWLALGPERTGTQTAVASAASVKTVKSAGQEQSKAQLEQVVLADHASANFSYLHNKYAVNLQSRSVYQAGNNYFVIAATGLLSASPEWSATTSEAERDHIEKMLPTAHDITNTGRVATKYELSFQVPSTLTNELSEVSSVLPASDVKTEEITNSLNWSLSGKVTGGAECEATNKEKGPEYGCTGKLGVELSTGISTSDSRKFTKKDVELANISLPGKPAWRFTIPPPKFVYDGQLWLTTWYRPAILATSTFQPEMTWVWKVSDSYRQRFPKGLPILVELSPTLFHAYQYYAFPWFAIKEVYLRPDVPFTMQVTLPWPPTTATTTPTTPTTPR